tara:strand:- start:43 stop:213 length:171 start_codon:yes stop_codon:yes gene_type:complete
MSENYCTTKGLGWAFLIILTVMVGVPIATTYVGVGHDDYTRYCKQTPLLPCFGMAK